MVVQFYGGVHGWLPIEEVGVQNEEQRPLGELFAVGQVVRAKVLFCQPRAERIGLSLNVRLSPLRICLGVCGCSVSFVGFSFDVSLFSSLPRPYSTLPRRLPLPSSYRCFPPLSILT